MTTKRIIVEQIDNEQPSTPSNYDGFSSGFIRGFSFKELGCTLIVFIGILLLMVLLC